jgi:membrane associated rhomboid family serine protease
MIRQQFSHLPEVVKNLLIINGLLYLATMYFDGQGGKIDLSNLFALHQFQSPDFMPHQLITHMFMHGGFTHLLFNMFALWMFGKTLENMWGGKRFLTYYMITGFGAALIYIGYLQFQIYEIANNFPELLEMAKERRYDPSNIDSFKITQLVNTPMVGASGAVYGLLLAFGMLFPNSLIYLYFAIPVKAKYFVGGIGILALISGIGNNPGDNIAHFAHLGGMIFGIILLKYWKKKGDIYF